MFSVYVLSEHGRAASVLLLLCYALLAATLLIAGGLLPESVSGRVFALASIALYFGMTSLYMAGTNLGKLVFTGQNIPFLSLASGSDLLMVTVLLAITMWCLRADIEGESDAFFSQQPWAFRISAGAVLVLLAWTGYLFLVIGRLGADSSLREDLRFSETALDRFRQNITTTDHSGAIRLLSDGTLDDPVPGSVTWIERKGVDLFNSLSQSARADRTRNLYYLTRDETGQPSVAINDDYFHQLSPFHVASPPWSGTVIATGSAGPTFVVLDTQQRIRLAHGGANDVVPLNSITTRSTFNEHVVLVPWAGGPNVCELKLQGRFAMVSPYPDRSNGSMARVWIDGKQLRTPTSVSEGQLITISGSMRRKTGRSQFSHTLIYIGRQAPTLAATLWRNGARVRVVSPGSLASYAESLGGALDAGARHTSNAAGLPQLVALTVDVDLNDALQGTLAANASPIYRGPGAHRRKMAAMAVMDTFTGSVLALPHWAAQAAVGTSSTERNLNLRNHAIGSTIKPLLLCAIASGYDGSGFDVTQLIVKHISDCSDDTMVHPHCSIAGVPLAQPWDCTAANAPEISARRYLVESRNYFAAVLGMTGMVTDAGAWHEFLGPAGSGTPVVYAGQSRVLDLKRVAANHIALTFQPDARPLSLEMPQSLLMRNMNSLFHAQLPFTNASTRDQQRRQDIAEFVPTLHRLGVDDYHLSELLPDPITLVTGSSETARLGVLPFFLGAPPSGSWSNIRMAESISRLATGARVRAHIEAAPPTRVLPMPAPVADTAWRNRNLIEPMGLAGLRNAPSGSPGAPWHGTAVQGQIELSKLVDEAGRRFGKTYRGMFKTGTLNERDTPWDSEMLMFVVGRWNGTAFVPGHTVSGYLYLADARLGSHGKGQKVSPWHRVGVAAPMLRQLVQFLESGVAAAPAAPHVVSPTPAAVAKPKRHRHRR
jgi:hypothetical protein